MTEARFQALIYRHLLPHMPGFAAKGGLLFVRPLEYVLRGYGFQGSNFDKDRFCVGAFAEPLFIPGGNVAVEGWGRLGSIRGKADKWWTLTKDNEQQVMADVLRLMKREGPTIIDKFKTLDDFVKNAITRKTNPYSPYPPEMVAYGAVLLGKRRLAEKMFDKVEWTLRDESQRRSYEEEILKRARNVRNTFRRDSQEAVAILRRWREETAAKLKLTKFLEPIE